MFLSHTLRKFLIETRRNVYKALMHQENIVRLVKGGIDMIQNKKGLSDIVTTALKIGRASCRERV